MATNITLTIDGKLIPTAICFIGNEMDAGQGQILVEKAVRTSEGLKEPGKATYPIADQLGFTDSRGVTGEMVLAFLGEWFDAKQAAE
jgi:hypothetical protein